ncbi:sensor histidine kinase [Streptomyces sp. YIM 98790]|uniref:sensor histidine kinase n=1 Tax=Streptomyces sp. YIM 98790 TaxID=2689077 RepID=UPI001FB6A37A|nr:sensor histidine kinase [Streptomyces sp. YIM 98790]
MPVTRAPSAPRTPRRVLAEDSALALAAGALGVLLALTEADGRRPGVLGWALLAACVLPLVWRRRRPLSVLLAHLAAAAPFHALDYSHGAPVPASVLALYTVAVTGPRVRTLLVAGGTLLVVVSVWTRTGPAEGLEMLRVTGWILAVLALGEAVRMHRAYVGAIRERAERAERTREEEAARRVAEERLRIARDLHDLLAHSITLIGVRTSVAAHVLRADPERLDHAAVAEALDAVADTCREARGELRRTLEVLRDREGTGPLPSLSSIPDLVRSAEAAGARVGCAFPGAGGGPAEAEVPEVPPAVGAAAYRIVQEALTNAVRHAGPGVRVTVGGRIADGRLLLTVRDTGRAAAGPGTPEPAGGRPGFGIPGMRERARSVGGTLTAGPSPDGGAGFTVTAALPLTDGGPE